MVVLKSKSLMVCCYGISRTIIWYLNWIRAGKSFAVKALHLGSENLHRGGKYCSIAGLQFDGFVTLKLLQNQ